MIDSQIVIATVFILYSVGIYCLVTRRDLIRLLIGLTILMNAANLNFIFLSAIKIPGLIDPLPHAIVIIAIVLDGCVIMVGIVLVVLIYRKYGSLDVEKLKKLRW